MIENAVVKYIRDNAVITAQVYWGLVAESANRALGTVNLVAMPGSETDNTTQKGYLQMQVSVRHPDLYEAGRIKNEIQDLLIHYAGIIADDESNNFQVMFGLLGDLGEFQEDISVGETADMVWHKPFMIACSYINAFVR
jgi:hypothetical protein